MVMSANLHPFCFLEIRSIDAMTQALPAKTCLKTSLAPTPRAVAHVEATGARTIRTEYYNVYIIAINILWMEEMLHHLGWLKPYTWDKPPINWVKQRHKLLVGDKPCGINHSHAVEKWGEANEVWDCVANMLDYDGKIVGDI